MSTSVAGWLLLGAAAVAVGANAVNEAVEEAAKRGASGETGKHDVLVNVWGFPDTRHVRFVWPQSMLDAHKIGFPPSSGNEWDQTAARYRDRKTGQVLPNLLRANGIDPNKVRRIGLIGFSAGSNDGLEHLIRSPADRAMLRNGSFVLALDGMHKWRSATPTNADVRKRYLRWSQMEPYFELAKRAHAGDGPALVLTSSDSQEPRPRGTHVKLTKTRQANADLLELLRREHGDVPALSSGSSFRRPITGEYSYRGQVRRRTMRLANGHGKNGLVQLHYDPPGPFRNETDARMHHVDQAWLLGPALLHGPLANQWESGA